MLTGGASSVYGADAVAGVVNFIMDTNFEGVRFDGKYSIWQHNQDNPSVSGGLNDAATSSAASIRQSPARPQFPLPTGSDDRRWRDRRHVTIGAGFDDGRGHAVAYFGYRNVKPVLQARSRLQRLRHLQNSGPVGAPTLRRFGDGQSRHGRHLHDDEHGADVTSTARGARAGNDRSGAQNLYNFAPLNYFQRPDERYIAGAFADYEIIPAIKPYLEFMFMDDRTLAQIAPSGDFGNTLTINCDNPLHVGGAVRRDLRQSGST